jgi:hypothetical protein
VTGAGRFVAGCIALIALIGLAVQFAASTKLTGSAPAAIWTMLRFFTVLTNLLVVATTAAVAAGRLRSPSLIGGTMLAILLVGAVYMLLLRGLAELSGGAALADTILHKVVPVAAAAFWLAFVPKGGLRWEDPLLWALYPLAYLLYALGRGAVDGRYPYPFIDLSRISVGAALFNAIAIALCFLAAGFVLVAIDRALGHRASTR